MLVRALALGLIVLVPQTDNVDPTLRAAVERFYATQQAEDIAGYLALWSPNADRPSPEQLKYIFSAGDDKFSEITITAVRPRGPQTVVRVSVNRERTVQRPDGSPLVFRTAIVAALTYAREDNEWKLLREGTPVDALADTLIAAPDADTRGQSLAEEPGLVSPLLVAAVSRQAAAAAQRGLYPRAQAIYEVALDVARRIGDKKLQADTLQNIGNALYYQRNFAAAKPVYQEFLAIERELGNEDGIATALVGLGTAQYTQFEYTDAFASFHEALAIQEKLDDTNAVATTLINTGNVQFLEGDFVGAAADYRRSRDLYHANSYTIGEARALDGLGRTLAAQGDLAGALDAFTSVLEEGRSRNVPGLQGGALLSIGDVHVRLGNLDLARGLFDQSRTQFERIHDLPNVGRAWQAMGRT
jgi:tetratricopeptide (TPR) repeat protein